MTSYLFRLFSPLPGPLNSPHSQYLPPCFLVAARLPDSPRVFSNACKTFPPPPPPAVLLRDGRLRPIVEAARFSSALVVFRTFSPPRRVGPLPLRSVVPSASKACFSFSRIPFPPWRGSLSLSPVFSVFAPDSLIVPCPGPFSSPLYSLCFL